jgi:formate/nitrite transporter FocA (FNT family)
LSAPEPHEIYERIEREGRRRLDRPSLELAATALVAGFDIVFGLIAFSLVSSSLDKHFGRHAAHFGGALAFGIAFVFIVVGRSELFTENFLVPIAGMRNERKAWLKLGELWTLSPVLNVLGGTALAIILSSDGVLPGNVGKAFRAGAFLLHTRSTLGAFLSAIGAGALITLMTWLVEGTNLMGVRILMAWLAGALLTLGAFNHVIVATLQLVFGIRYGAHIRYAYVVGNFFLAVAGNMVGGLLFVTLTRFGQAKGSSDGG